MLIYAKNKFETIGRDNYFVWVYFRFMSLKTQDELEILWEALERYQN